VCNVLQCMTYCKAYTRCFIKNDLFLFFFHNSLKWWSIYTKFVPVVAEEILIQNISSKYGSLLNILCKTWRNADVIMCHGYKLDSLNWCCQLLPCFDGELNLVRYWKVFIVSALSNIGTWNQASCNPKTQPFCKLGVLVHCLARTRKSPVIPTDS